MPRYRLHRIKETSRESFRWAPHVGGEVTVKAKDYEMAAVVVEGATPYAVWKTLGQSGDALRTGDLLEQVREESDETSKLLITKYIGFEPARWFVAEAKPEAASPSTWERVVYSAQPD